jgi:tRNA threonylcarbamoyladenosine biosynthesis protein TsaE
MVDMNTAKTFKIDCLGLNATYKFGEQIGARLRGGEVFELVGDLGSGKTALVRGIARALGLQDEVTSPSFTINNLYQSNKLSLSHYDFYRLNEAGVMKNELAESMSEPDTVVFIEWGDTVKDVLPDERVVITCTTTGEESRHYECTYPESLSYFFEGVKK